MKPAKIKRSSIFLLFIGVALMADLLPAPGLGKGIIQTMAEGLTRKKLPVENVWQGQSSFVRQSPSERPVESAQNNISPRTGNGG